MIDSEDRVETGPCGRTHKPLNPWVQYWPACGCENPDYDSSIPEPQTIEELLAWAEKRDNGDKA
jgi:hypothetical protein